MIVAKCRKMSIYLQCDTKEADVKECELYKIINEPDNSTYNSSMFRQRNGWWFGTGNR